MPQKMPNFSFHFGMRCTSIIFIVERRPIKNIICIYICVKKSGQTHPHRNRSELRWAFIIHTKTSFLNKHSDAVQLASTYLCAVRNTLVWWAKTQYRFWGVCMTVMSVRSFPLQQEISGCTWNCTKNTGEEKNTWIPIADSGQSARCTTEYLNLSESNCSNSAFVTLSLWLERASGARTLLMEKISSVPCAVSCTLSAVEGASDKSHAGFQLNPLILAEHWPMQWSLLSNCSQSAVGISGLWLRSAFGIDLLRKQKRLIWKCSESVIGILHCRAIV